MALGLWAHNNIRLVEPSKVMLVLLLMPLALISEVRLCSKLGTFLRPFQVQRGGNSSLVWVSRTVLSSTVATRYMWFFLFKLIKIK